MQANVFQRNKGECAAFLSNSDRISKVIVNFKGLPYELPPRSISILPDCKNVVFNTAKVSLLVCILSFAHNFNGCNLG